MNYNKTIEIEWTGGHYEPFDKHFNLVIHNLHINLFSSVL
jgi:hypothetical protein